MDAGTGPSWGRSLGIGPGLAAVRGGIEWKRNKGHLVDALALRGEEGRGTLRKARGRCERSVIPGSPNGATHPKGATPAGIRR